MMKRYFWVLLLAVLFAGCDTGAGPQTEPVNPLVGTWKEEDDTYITVITFTDNEFTSYFHSNTHGGYGGENNGYYTYTDTIIFFEISDPDSLGPYMNSVYKLYNNKLYIVTIPSGSHTSVLTKQ
jgi:hypothetical protein